MGLSAGLKRESMYTLWVYLIDFICRITTYAFLSIVKATSSEYVLSVSLSPSQVRLLAVNVDGGLWDWGKRDQRWRVWPEIEA